MKPQTLNAGTDLTQVSQTVEQHARVLSNVSFGDGTGNSEDQNLDCTYVNQNFAAANTDVTIQHNLGRVPVGYIPVGLSAAAIIYTGTVGATASAITLKSNAAGVTAKILLF